MGLLSSSRYLTAARVPHSAAPEPLPIVPLLLAVIVTVLAAGCDASSTTQTEPPVHLAPAGLNVKSLTAQLAILRRLQTAADRVQSLPVRASESDLPDGIYPALTRRVTGLPATEGFPVSIYLVVGPKQQELPSSSTKAAVFLIGVTGGGAEFEDASGVNGLGQTAAQITPLAWTPIDGTAVSIVPDGVKRVTWRFTAETCQRTTSTTSQNAATASVSCQPNGAIQIVRPVVRDNIASAKVGSVGYLQSATWYGEHGAVASAGEPSSRPRSQRHHP